MNGTLYIVATPIGNTEDITVRARRILGEVDIVAAEDTRTTQVLLRILGIKNKTISNHKFNEKSQLDFLLSELESGRNVAIVSDAGTPCVSDPGGLIVSAAAKRGINIVGVCGASAVITAVSVSGFSSGSFAFYGFLPKTVNEIKKAVDAAIKSNVNSSVFFESPKRIKKTLELMVQEAPHAELCLCNDLSKMYERIYRGTPEEILCDLLENPAAEKGEYTLVVNFGAGNTETQQFAPGSASPETMAPEALLIDHIVKNGGTLKDAVNAMAFKHSRIGKKEFYAASLRLKNIFLNDE